MGTKPHRVGVVDAANRNAYASEWSWYPGAIEPPGGHRLLDFGLRGCGVHYTTQPDGGDLLPLQAPVDIVRSTGGAGGDHPKPLSAQLGSSYRLRGIVL